MAKYSKSVEVDAVQFTGHNWRTVQDFAGVRNIDPAGKYFFPLFDEADIWAPDRLDKTASAVLQVRGVWEPVHDSDWIVREAESGLLTIMNNETFTEAYGQPDTAAKRKTTRKKQS